MSVLDQITNQVKILDKKRASQEFLLDQKLAKKS